MFLFISIKTGFFLILEIQGKQDFSFSISKRRIHFSQLDVIPLHPLLDPLVVDVLERELQLGGGVDLEGLEHQDEPVVPVGQQTSVLQEGIAGNAAGNHPPQVVRDRDVDDRSSGCNFAGRSSIQFVDRNLARRTNAPDGLGSDVKAKLGLVAT